MDHAKAIIFLEKYFGPLLIAAFAATAPIHALLVTVGILIFGDMVMGIMSALKRGHPITSARLRDTVTKMLVYHTVLVLGFLVEKWMLHDNVPLVKLSASVIGLVEIKSVYENASVVLGKPLFSEILSKLGSKNRP